jgi:hypothetical protein
VAPCGPVLALTCGGHVVSWAAPATIVGVSPSLVRGPDAPAGQAFTTALGKDLSTDSSVSGEPFYATVQSPLAGNGGRVIVPIGAMLLGHVERVTDGVTPHIVLASTRFRLRTGGATPVLAKVIDVPNATKRTGEAERSLLASPLEAEGPRGPP